MALASSSGPLLVVPTVREADALTWAAQAKKEGQVRTCAKGGPLVESSHLTHLG